MRCENLHFLIKILLIIHIAVVKWRGMTQIVGYLVVAFSIRITSLVTVRSVDKPPGRYFLYLPPRTTHKN